MRRRDIESLSEHWVCLHGARTERTGWGSAVAAPATHHTGFDPHALHVCAKYERPLAQAAG